MGNAQVLQFNSEQEWLDARKDDVTASDMAALLGISKFKSRFQLWHEKKGNLENDFVENDRAKWGKRMQNVIAHGICEDNDWSGEDLGLFYLRDSDLHMGCSLDTKVICPSRGTGLMEVKNVGLDAFSASWTADDAPAYYETQLMTELHMAHKAGLDIDFGVIAALVGGNRAMLYFRDYDPEIGAMMDEECAKFWASIDANEEPKPDYAVDAKALERIRGAVIEKTCVDLSGNNHVYSLIDEYTEASELEKDAKARKDAAKTELLDLIGDASKAVVNGFSITASMVAGTDISYFREPYRLFRVNKVKAKG